MKKILVLEQLVELFDDESWPCNAAQAAELVSQENGIVAYEEYTTMYLSNDDHARYVFVRYTKPEVEA